MAKRPGLIGEGEFTSERGAVTSTASLNPDDLR